MPIASSGTASGAPGRPSTTSNATFDWVSHARAHPEPVTSAEPGTSHPLDLAGRSVLLAMDDSEGATAGMHVAHALATKYHAVIHVINVVDTRAAPMPAPLGLALAIGEAVIGPEAHAERIDEMRATLSAATGRAIEWPIRVAWGAPASSIVKEAERVGAALIIVGLRRHGRLERLVDDETVLNVMRNAACPVLGVVPGTTGLPTRVLAAVDFSETSLLAVRTARAVVGDGAVLVLAYVSPLVEWLPDNGESVIHELGVQSGFAKIARELGDEGLTFDHVVLHHQLPRTSAEMILEYADVATTDLITAGSARHGRLDRWMVGSVSTDLVRNGRHSILIVPPRATRHQ